MPKSKTPAVFFNASVILAGLKSPLGGSGKILRWGKAGKINALASEVIIDEVLRNVVRLGLNQGQIGDTLKNIFPEVASAPGAALVKSFQKVSVDVGDSHVLASSQENKADFLVTLDKKHLLILQDKIKIFKIVSPGQLIEMYRQQGKR